MASKTPTTATSALCALSVPDETIAALQEVAAYGTEQYALADTIRRTYGIATAVRALTSLLTPQAMEPIMALQNSPLGFLTDNRSGGYSVDTVRTAYIQALIEGLDPVGNEWNILASRMYVTKNGMKHKLRNIPGLRYSVRPGIPRNAGEKGALVPVHLEWSVGGEARQTDLEFAVKLNAGMGADALVGKATRKALAWLYEEVTGNSVSEGEVGDSAPIDITPRATAQAVPQAADPQSPLPVMEAM